ncbi:MAG: murein biosynthesis integral membrane protein MurJ [Gammaproteobacteria bacterium]
MSNPLKSTGLVGIWTFLSRILGLVRDVVFARFFGAGAGMDVFVVAFQIPNFMRRLFAEGAFSQAFVPVLGEVHSKGDERQTHQLINRVAGTLGAILIVVTLVFAFAAPLLVWLFASGFSDEPAKFALATDLLRITVWYLLFISLTALAGGVLNTYGRFGAPAFTPVLLNVCLIGAVMFFTSRFERPMVGLAWGVFLAGATQLAFQLPFLKAAGYSPRPVWAWHDSGVQKIVHLMLPALFGASVAQVNLIIDRAIASYLQDGSISWLYYSDRLLEFPLGVFTIALATVVLPFLSKQHASNNTRSFSSTLDWAQRLVVLITVPAAAGLLLLSGPLIATVFQYDAFDARDTYQAVFSLSAYSIGLVGFSFVKVLVPGYFSRQDAKTPVKIGVITLIFNIFANVAFVVPMLKTGFVAPHMGLALATSIAAWLNAGLLWRGLRRAGVMEAQPGWPKLIMQVAVATLTMGVLLVFLKGDTAEWVSWSLRERVFKLAVLIPAAIVVYFAMLALLGVRTGHFRHPGSDSDSASGPGRESNQDPVANRAEDDSSQSK